MATSDVPLIDEEVPFSIDELFFSTTDGDGRIRACNGTFVRVSEHAAEALIGRAHNVVRHPDTPRGAFWLMWRALEEGRPFAAYVKNRSRTGRHYWVVAVATPSSGGYLSVRLKPTTETFAAVADVYRRVCESEREMADAGANVRDVATHGARLILDALAGLGFPDYESFQNHFLPAEVRARAAALRGVEPLRAADPVSDALARTSAHMDDLFAHVGAYHAASGALKRASDAVRGVADDVRLSSLNGVVAASRLSREGATLGVVAREMTRSSREIAALVARLDDDLLPVVSELGRLAFRVAAARLQVDMARAYVGEAGRGADDAWRPVVDELVGCLTESSRRVVELVETVGASLGGTLGVVGLMDASFATLRALQISGRIEVAGVADSAGFEVLLADVSVQLGRGMEQVGELRAAARGCAVDRDGIERLRALLDDVAGALGAGARAAAAA